jgi:hypothetical protein
LEATVSQWFVVASQTTASDLTFQAGQSTTPNLAGVAKALVSLPESSANETADRVFEDWDATGFDSF